MDLIDVRSIEMKSRGQIALTFVSPGDVISEDASNYLRGHGTYERNGKLHACVCGRVEKTNKLITVSPLKQRYSGEVGNVVVGRIKSVESTYWKVEIQSKTIARLQLSSINFPGSIQRRKTFEDQMKMREIYVENDVIVAEVQQIMMDNVCSLQTRSSAYGKLTNGVLVIVNSGLIKQSKQHFYTFSFGVELVLGRNGYVWISIPIKSEKYEQNKAFYGTRLENKKYEKITLKDRENICRVRNAILALEDQSIQIYPETIVDVVDASSAMEPKEMLNKSTLITEKARKRIEKINIEKLKLFDEEEKEEEFNFDI